MYICTYICIYTYIYIYILFTNIIETLKHFVLEIFWIITSPQLYCFKHSAVHILVHLCKNQTRKFIDTFLSQNILIPPY